MRRDTGLADCNQGNDAAPACSGWFPRLAEAIQDWRERKRQQREFEALASRGDLDRVLAEVGLSSGQLPVVMRAHPKSRMLRARMMRWMGIDPSQLPINAELRDIEWRCIRCESRRQCEDWLSLPAAGRASPEFCPNLRALERIRAWQNWAAAAPRRDGTSSSRTGPAREHQAHEGG